MASARTQAREKRSYRKPALRRRRRLAEVTEGDATNIIVTGHVTT